MKFEWRKHEKALYGAKSIPALVDIPKFNFIMMKENGLQRISDCHREIYLTNRTKEDKLKTILRYKVN